MTLDLVSLPLLAVLVGVIFITSRAIHNVFFHPLRKFPGPLTHKITSMVIGYHQFRGSGVYHLRDLHDKYGTIVRVGPNELSFIDEQAWADIYGHRTSQGIGDLPKDLRTNRPEDNNVPNIINANDVDHRRFRRIQAPLFSDKAISAQEPLITDFVKLLISQLHARANSSLNVVDMVEWYTFTTFDVLGELAFGNSFNCLKNGYSNDWIENTNLLLRDISNWATLQKFPWPLNKILYSMTPKNKRNASKERNIQRKQVVHQRIERDTSPEKPDFMSQMLKYKDEKGMTISEIETNSGVLIIAGSETTATLLSGLTYLLLTNLEHLEKLTKLIRTTFASPNDITGLALYRLDYLSAIIDESFRLYPPVAGSLPRMTKKGGSVICGEVIPEYTTVSIPHFVAYRSPRNWTDPEKFVPER
ncbi:Cytochrome P450 monooxygenase aclL [Erysiphe neolycopersici]|uniref:Cytochrome P450 monooxygenase aclL n=1 Tax=Erysiphe neolycopersici TaxID=212602 RepID=A0A420HWW5_9PEZI|nr:Cytochrome P450 monooxygenase aclL [Erysiphe neolycopersici]